MVSIMWLGNLIGRSNSYHWQFTSIWWRFTLEQAAIILNVKADTDAGNEERETVAGCAIAVTHDEYRWSSLNPAHWGHTHKSRVYFFHLLPGVDKLIDDHHLGQSRSPDLHCWIALEVLCDAFSEVVNIQQVKCRALVEPDVAMSAQLMMPTVE